MSLIHQGARVVHDPSMQHHHSHPDDEQHQHNPQQAMDDDGGELVDYEHAGGELPEGPFHHDGAGGAPVEDGSDMHQVVNGVNDVGAELGLNALRDSPDGVKPFYPYSTLIRYAIKGSPGQKLLLEDIYYAIETRFPWFKTAPAGWKNSIRHNLSLNSSFQKVPRPLTDRGKGAYWTVNDNVDPRAGSHRVRKKKPRGPTVNGKQNQAAHDAQLAAAMGVPAGMQFGHPMAVPPGVAIPGAPGERGPDGQQIIYPFPGFDPNTAAAYMQGAMRFPTNGENVELSLSPEYTDQGVPIWRSIWLNELLKLQHATAEADRNGQDMEWYRGMIERLRIAFAPQPGFEEHEDPAAAAAAAQAQAVAAAQAQAQAAAAGPTRRSARRSTRAGDGEGEDGGEGEADGVEGGVQVVEDVGVPHEEIDGDDEDNDPDYAEEAD